MEQPLKDMSNYIVNKQYKLIKKLGAGAFGEIYSAQFNNDDYAVKIERADSKHPQLQFESKLYHYLNSHQGQGIPKYYGLFQQDNYNFLIMELLGKSLEDLFNENNRRFSLQTVAILGVQMLECIEFLHSMQFLHRDIKPDNFLLGKTKKDRVYMVDYGLAKRFIAKDIHIPYKENKALTGTARYASINTHLGIEQSRRDDLESLGYVLMYFIRGQLPWQNLRANNQKEKYDRIMEKKLATSTEMLCKGYPKQLFEFIEYSKNLKFDEKPDYQMLKGYFISMMKENELRMEYIYDWDDEDTQRDKLQLRMEEHLPTIPKTQTKQNIVKTKTSSIGSMNKVFVKSHHHHNNTNNNVSLNNNNNSNIISNNNYFNNKIQMNKARQIIKKHSSLHYQ